MCFNIWGLLAYGVVACASFAVLLHLALLVAYQRCPRCHGKGTTVGDHICNFCDGQRQVKRFG